MNNGKVFVAPVWWHLHAQNMLEQYQRGLEMTTEAEKESFLTQLRSQVGNTGDTITARDAVNQSTIRNWCDAVSESNPHYLNPEAAEEGPYGQIVAPPAMLQVWSMPGLIMGQQPQRSKDPSSATYAMLDEAGFVSVVATNVEYVFHRYLKLGDVISGRTKLVDVSEEKATGLGIGHFVTTETEYVDENDESVGSMFFRILKFRPGTGRVNKKPDPKAEALEAAGLNPDDYLSPPERPTRPRPQWNQDQEWFWEGLKNHELRIQRFTDDGTLMFPPANANPNTHSMEYDWIVSSGKGTLYSHTVVHYPQVPSFDYPLIVGLVELEEGVRIITNIVNVKPEQIEIGMPVEVCFPDTNSDDDIVLHQFQPAQPSRTEETKKRSEMSEGDQLPLCPVPLTPRLIISTALATRDFQDVHHDRDAAHQKGSKDIFMNILSTAGITARWLGDWAGNNVIFEDLKIQLGAPNYPYDTMTMSGNVQTLNDDGSITVSFNGDNKLGSHVKGTATLRFTD